MQNSLKNVPNFPKYFVDIDNGVIYSDHKGDLRKLNPTEAPSGYLTLTLYNNGESKSTTVHGVVMAAYLGTWYWDKPEVDHKDHDRKNNKISNLRLSTRSEQMDEITNSNLSEALKGNTNHNKQAISKATRGSRNNKAKLTEEDVRFIRETFKGYGLKTKSTFVKDMSKHFNVSESAIYRVLSEKFWVSI